MATRRARVEIRRDPDSGGTLHLLVQDWGQGFDAEAHDDDPPKNGHAGRHVGLHGMRERANLLGGTFQISSTIGEGTIVQVALPILDGADSATPFPFDFGDMAGAMNGVDGTDSVDGMDGEDALDKIGGAVGHWPLEESGRE